MKAEIGKNNQLILIAETQTEAFAIQSWLKLPLETTSVVLGINQIPYKIKKFKKKHGK